MAKKSKSKKSKKTAPSATKKPPQTQLVLPYLGSSNEPSGFRFAAPAHGTSKTQKNGPKSFPWSKTYPLFLKTASPTGTRFKRIGSAEVKMRSSSPRLSSPRSLSIKISEPFATKTLEILKMDFRACPSSDKGNTLVGTLSFPSGRLPQNSTLVTSFSSKRTSGTATRKSKKSRATRSAAR